MIRSMRNFSLLGLALAIAVGAASIGLTKAEDAAEKKVGTVSGKVVDKDGKAVAGATVVALAANQRRGPGEGGGGADKPKTNAAEEEKPKRPAPGAGERPKPLAETTTAEDGTFKLEGVPAGKVAVIARKEGAGRSRPVSVEVVADQDTKVEDLKLQPPTPRKEGAEKPAK